MSERTSTQSKKRRISPPLQRLLRHDARLADELGSGYHLVGLDEVGRGSLITGVVGGAACLPRTLNRRQKQVLRWLDDSKKLSPGLRAELSAEIQACCWVGIGETTREEVDTLNVHQASLLAIHRALNHLVDQAQGAIAESAVFCLLDGRALMPGFPSGRQRAIVKGDGQSAAIAAASVVAKHYRDEQIRALAQVYPGYDWENNMGYPTPAHLQALQTLGVTPHHRRHYKSVRDVQLSLGV